MDALLAMAEPRGLAVIEDAAQAHGARWRAIGKGKSEIGWRKVGTIGRVGCFSFWEDKIMTTGGEGGAVITGDDALAERMRRIRHHGEGPIAGERAYYHLELGYNYRMTSMQAATGLVQLRKLDGYLEARRRNTAYLSERLGELDGIDQPFVADYAVHSYYKYIGRLRPETGIDITRFVQALAAEGVPVSRRYPTPLPQQPVFRELETGACPTAERLAGELFTLLVHPTVETADLDDVVAAIRKVVWGLGQ
jgi:perosamine synthetase